MIRFKYCRQKSHVVRVGDVTIGGDNPIVVQSMTTTPTEDTALSSHQVMRIAQAGGQLVRLTAQGRSQAENLANIKDCLRQQGCMVPLVADIHFTSSLALIAARAVEKVRINPGNFVDKRANFSAHEFTEQQWQQELDRQRERLLELITVCREHGTALRIGVNHGSLSDRIMSRYGNTPQGMVASAMEFLEICVKDNFMDVVVSIKSSNVGVMVQSYRLLSEQMKQRGMTFPLHLGVTEAGEGQQGRIRSGVGIGTLLGQGLGDTIRVSLTEPPENEIPAARALAQYLTGDPLWNPPVVEMADYTYTATPIVVGGEQGDFSIEQCAAWPRYTVDQIIAGQVEASSDTPIIISSPYRGADWGQSIRHAVNLLALDGSTAQTVIYKQYDDSVSLEELQLYAAADFGGLFVDKLVGGMWVESSAVADTSSVCLDIMQASRVRISSADIISCPGCGRTLYDLESTVRLVKGRFSHYKGLKLAVMGCIVNGPGEMADAEFGYVGSGPGLVTLYKGTQVVERNIPQNEALDKLEELINSQWNR